jgi:ribosomal 50S subunit-recycling heat shock protein
MTYSRLTMDDLINIRRKDTKEKASVNIGDLIKITIDKQGVIGIVLKVDDKTMKLQNPQGEIKWISLYVIYEIL